MIQCNYEPVPSIVEDREAIVKSKRIVSEKAVAMGATSEAQALRYGRWKLWTAQNQNEIVSFRTGLQGALFVLAMLSTFKIEIDLELITAEL